VSDDDWYLLDRRGVRHGPYERDFVQQLVSRQELLPDTPVWFTGLARWNRADRVLSFPATGADAAEIRRDATVAVGKAATAARSAPPSTAKRAKAALRAAAAPVAAAAKRAPVAASAVTQPVATEHIVQRVLAAAFDLLLLAVIQRVLIRFGVIRGELFASGRFVLVAWAVLEGALMKQIGTTPGLWLFSITVRSKDGGRLDEQRAWLRSAAVPLALLLLTFSSFLGFLVVMMGLFTLARLRAGHAPWWDEISGSRVTHEPIGEGRRVLAGILLGVLVLAGTGAGLPFRGADAVKIDTEDFRARPGKFRIADHPTRSKGLRAADKEARRLLAEDVVRLGALQNALYAADQWSLLLIFQAMDAAGKDSTIKHVMSGINPQGCQVYSFKQPSAMELDHDFLWRTTECLPERGRIGVFNRSYYEEVLVVRVHPRYLEAQRLPDAEPGKRRFWKHRFESIVDFERHLHRNGTKVVKFFLNVSRDEQRNRFLERLDDPSKNWKFSLGDVEERKYWPEYQAAYEDCIRATSSKDSPWYVVPADDKKIARLIVARVMVETMEAMKLSTPTLSPAREAELAKARELLSGAGS
jgi:PPK2 family polyphosphate:nucleotide phosphotransferase